MNTFFEKKWTTFQGKRVSFKSIDHQHLSNCYWFNRIVRGISDSDLGFVKDELAKRFNGQLMPYRPHIDFVFEITFLKQHNMLVQTNPFKQEILFEGHWIGEIITPV